MKAYELTADGLEPKGTVCFPFAGYDYGLASDDTRITGREHKSFTKNRFGRGPSFTHPVEALREVEIDDLPPPDDEYVKTVCLLGAGKDCCRYLTMGGGGWSCEKLSPMGDSIDEKVHRKQFLACGNNCDGRASR